MKRQLMRMLACAAILFASAAAHGYVMDSYRKDFGTISLPATFTGSGNVVDFQLIRAGTFYPSSSGSYKVSFSGSTSSLTARVYETTTRKMLLPSGSSGTMTFNRGTLYTIEVQCAYLATVSWCSFTLSISSSGSPGTTSYCTVTFNPNGGSVSPTSRSVASGSTIGALPTPTRTDYTFAGWFTSSSGGTQVYASTTVTSSMTLYAHWTYSPSTPTYYAVTFNPNGGSVSPTSRSVASGSTIGALPTPTRTDYTFAGWFTSSSGGTQVYASTTVTSSMTLYAHWTYAPSVSLQAALDNYSLIFTTGGDASWYGQTERSCDAIDSARSGAISDGQETWMQTTVSGTGLLSFKWYVSCETGSTKNWDYLAVFADGVEQGRIAGTNNLWTAKTIKFTTSGSHTVKWVYHKDASVSKGIDAGFVDTVSWQPQSFTYTIRYYSDNWGGSYTERTCTRDTSVTLESPSTLGTWKTGAKTFNGWSLTPGSSFVNYAHRACAKNFAASGATLNLYPVWPEQTTYTIRYYSDNTGGSYTERTYTSDKSVLLESPSTLGTWRSGASNFYGWSLSPGSSYVYYAHRACAQNFASAGATLNLYPVWPTLSYTIRFHKNDGSGVYVSQTYLRDAKIILPSPNTLGIWKAGCKEFYGWALTVTGYPTYENRFTAKNFTGAGKVLNLYAVWTIQQQKTGSSNALGRSSRKPLETVKSGSLYLAEELYGVIGVEATDAGATVSIATVGGETSGPYDCTVGADGALTGVIPGYGALDAIADDTDETLTGTLGDFDIE